MDSYISSSTKPLYRGTQIVWYILGVIEILLAFRLILKLLAANPYATFTQLIYATTQFLVYPFINVFHVTYLQGSVFEWTTLLAMAVYWIIALGLIRLFIMSRSVSTPQAAQKLENQD